MRSQLSEKGIVHGRIRMFYQKLLVLDPPKMIGPVVGCVNRKRYEMNDLIADFAKALEVFQVFLAQAVSRTEYSWKSFRRFHCQWPKDFDALALYNQCVDRRYKRRNAHKDHLQTVSAL
jgi:hypothetical protein